MKKLLYILLFIPLALFGQVDDPCYSVNDYNLLTQESNPPITLDLLSGWNMIGYGCTVQADAQDLLAPISDKIIIAKNNAGSVYMPEFGFNGIGNLLPNQGYMFKMNETVIGFELCINLIPFYQVDGCTDCDAINFNKWATLDDGSCEYNNCTDSSADNFGETLPCIYYGCTDPLAANFDPYADTEDGSCVVAEACPYDNYLEYSPDAISYNANLCTNVIVQGCMNNLAENYNPSANVSDNSCVIYGCTDSNAYNFNSIANIDDDTCYPIIVGCLNFEADNYLPPTNNVLIDINTSDEDYCIYYGCTDPSAGNFQETANTDDGSCLIGGCLNYTAENFNDEAVLDDGSCVIYGCIFSAFPNYNPAATIDDGSCDINSDITYGCTDPSTFTFDEIATIDNGTCYTGSFPSIGEIIPAGIVFYVDSISDFILVAAHSDIGEYEWGCYQIDVPSAEGKSIGDGYQNTLNIINDGCSSVGSGNTAAQASINYNGGGYNTWFLPSTFELLEMYFAIGNGSPLGNIGGFQDEYYFSSSDQKNGHPNYDNNHTYAGYVYFENGNYGGIQKSSANLVRPIIAFGNYSSGCIDEDACNYDSSSVMNDGSCIYPESGFDCEGNYNVGLGWDLFGGIVIYFDEISQKGLVISEQPIDNYSWGDCNNLFDSAHGISSGLGFGYQNTITLSSCSYAAQSAIEFESGDYSDWFLPSIDELELAFNFGILSLYDDEDCLINWETLPAYDFIPEQCFAWSSSVSDNLPLAMVNYMEEYYYNEIWEGIPMYPYAHFGIYPVRAFGNWVMGCMDSSASNFNPDADMADGSCIY